MAWERATWSPWPASGAGHVPMPVYSTYRTVQLTARSINKMTLYNYWQKLLDTLPDIDLCKCDSL